MTAENEKKNENANFIIEKLFEYDDYRSFLKDYFEEQRRLKSFFSHRYFAQKAGFSSHSFCAYLMEGKRNLTFESIRKLIKGMSLGGKKAQYFEALVFYNQAKTAQDKEQHLKSLQRIRRSTEFYKLNPKQAAYYDHWYLPVLRELAVYSDWKDDYTRLGRMVRPALSADEARKGIQTLLDIELLVKNADGSYSQPSLVISAESIPGYVLRGARRDMILRAIEASDYYNRDERHLSYSVLATSRRVFDQATQLLDEVRKKILLLAMEDETVDGIYAVNLNLFPLSHPIAAQDSEKGDKS
jgi:uncharacterized protein (TIGR02147 family)